MSYKLKAVSQCKTYRETMTCLTKEEADQLAGALRADGWSVSIMTPEMEALRKEIDRLNSLPEVKAYDAKRAKVAA
jgi:hypothetical protein